MRKLWPILTICLFCLLAGCRKDNPYPPEPDPEKPVDVEPAAGATVYGTVTCNGKGIPDVAVSDGYKVVLTDGDGVYNIASDKLLKYVFISIPDGYEVPSDGALPHFSEQLVKGAGEVERADFKLVKVDQSSYTMLFFGDMHLAARTFCGDIAQFREFAEDVNDFLSGRKGRHYALTLGDMSWDYYWVANGYDLNNYVQEINRDFKGLQIFNTMGNHDNDSQFSGDFDGAATFRRIIGPTYYSFNIGGTHYIVLDDIEYFNSPAGERNFRSRVTQEQIDWMVRDIAHVDRKTPVVVAMHCPLYRRDGSSALGNLWELIQHFEGYDRVQFVTGHTHLVYNVDMLHRSVHIYENNSGAVCGAWWMTGCNYPGLHMCTDGAPGGYRVMDFTGRDFTTFYKATGRPEGHQFRVYDGVTGKNEILLNVWDYDPSWKVSVTEEGKALTVTQVKGIKDPLYIVAYEEYETAHGYSISYPASTTDHMFKATASKPDSDITVTVTDRYGRTFTETVARPKKFAPEEYIQR